MPRRAEDPLRVGTMRLSTIPPALLGPRWVCSTSALIARSVGCCACTTGCGLARCSVWSVPYITLRLAGASVCTFEDEVPAMSMCGARVPVLMHTLSLQLHCALLLHYYYLLLYCIVWNHNSSQITGDRGEHVCRPVRGGLP